MGSNHIIAIDVGEAIGAIRETLRIQLAAMRPSTTIGLPTRSEDGALVLAVVDLRDGSLDRRLDDAEHEAAIDKMARNVMQTLYGLEVQS